MSELNSFAIELAQQGDAQQLAFQLELFEGRVLSERMDYAFLAHRSEWLSRVRLAQVLTPARFSCADCLCVACSGVLEHFKIFSHLYKSFVWQSKTRIPRQQ